MSKFESANGFNSKRYATFQHIEISPPKSPSQLVLDHPNSVSFLAIICTMMLCLPLTLMKKNLTWLPHCMQTDVVANTY